MSAITFTKEQLSDAGRKIEDAFARVGIPAQARWSDDFIHSVAEGEVVFHCNIDEILGRKRSKTIASLLGTSSKDGEVDFTSTISFTSEAHYMKSAFNEAFLEMNKSFYSISEAEKYSRKFNWMTNKIEHDLLMFGKKRDKVFTAFKDVDKILSKMIKTALKNKLTNGKRMSVSCKT